MILYYNCNLCFTNVILHKGSKRNLQYTFRDIRQVKYLKNLIVLIVFDLCDNFEGLRKKKSFNIREWDTFDTVKTCNLTN